MKFYFPWQKKNKFVNLTELEAKLDAVLQPVKMRQEFISELRQTLMGKTKKQKFSIKNVDPKTSWLIFGGVLSSVMIIFSGIRAVIALLGAIGLIQINKKIEETSNNQQVMV
ncbi:MAG: hypothetical protein HOH75_08300 [Chloroflexi bacterium]|nr:hypothetical protein [Chloroflexota bacterium]